MNLGVLVYTHKNYGPRESSHMKILVSLVLTLLMINLLLFYAIPPDKVVIPGGNNPPATAEGIEGIILTILFAVIPVLGFLCGLVIGIVPYKEWSYKTRFVRVSLGIMISLYPWMIVFSAVRLWYM